MRGAVRGVRRDGEQRGGEGGVASFYLLAKVDKFVCLLCVRLSVCVCAHVHV